jgi:hypothetical protein
MLIVSNIQGGDMDTDPLLKSRSMVQTELEKHRNLSPDIRSDQYYADKTKLSRSLIRLIRTGKLLLKNDAAFVLMEVIKSDPIEALIYLRSVPSYKNYAARQLNLIEQRGGELAKIGDERLSLLTEACYRDLIAFVAVPRSKEVLTTRKGADTVDMANFLVSKKILKEEKGKIAIGSFHIVGRIKMPKVVKSQMEYFQKRPELLEVIHENIKTVSKIQLEEIKEIFAKTSESLSKVGSNAGTNSDDIGVMMGLYLGLTEE